jgi:hypothetical protein
MPCSSGNAQSSSSIITPRSAFCAFSSGIFEQLQDHRLIASEHFAARDAKQQRVTDLPGGAGDCDTDRGLGHGGLQETGCRMILQQRVGETHFPRRARAALLARAL